MLLRLYTSSQPALLITYPVLAALGLWPVWVKRPVDLRPYAYPAEQWIESLFPGPFESWSVALILISFAAWQVNALYNRHEFFSSAVFTPGLVYVLLAIGLMPLAPSNALLLANCFVIAGIDQVLRVYHQQRALSEYFLAGFFLGCAALIYPPMLILGLGLWLSISYSRSFRWREYAVSALAFVSPFVWWLAVREIAMSTQPAVLFYYRHDPEIWKWWGGQVTGWPTRIFLLLSMAALLIGLPRFMNPGGRVTNRVRNLSSVFVIFTLFSIGALAMEVAFTGHWALGVVLVPFSVFIGHWYTNYRYSLLAPFVFYFWLAALTVRLVMWVV